jgi:hypothetical protein
MRRGIDSEQQVSEAAAVFGGVSSGCRCRIPISASSRTAWFTSPTGASLHQDGIARRRSITTRCTSGGVLDESAIA